MTDRHRSIRFGIFVILAALGLRAWSGRAAIPVQPNTAAVAAYTETGPKVRSFPSLMGFSPEYPSETAVPALSADLRFGEDELPELTNSAALEADLVSLLTAPLRWDLRAGAVLILSTHATESYTKSGETYEESAAFRTLDEGYNMLSVGDRVEQLLAAAGITVIRDRQLHDYPSYNGSYAHARERLSALLEAHPEVSLVLDLHRDAADGPDGRQYRPLAGDRAKLMVVLGSGFGHWQENLSLALKLCAQLERQHPGITRPIQLRRATFNQDLSPGALLIEVGAAGNTRPEALRAAEELADAIIALARGTV
jgi:stage II sporulation protein P